MQTMELWEFCSRYPMEEKLFVVPTRAIGLQMVNKIARDGHSVLNLKVISLTRLAFEICEEYIANKDKLIIDNVLGGNLIIQILRDLAQRDSEAFFFKEDLINTGTADEVYKAIME